MIRQDKEGTDPARLFHSARRLAFPDCIINCSFVMSSGAGHQCLPFLRTITITRRSVEVSYCAKSFFKSSKRHPLPNTYFIFMEKFGLVLRCISKVVFFQNLDLCERWKPVCSDYNTTTHFLLSPHLARYPPPRLPIHPSRSFIFYRGRRCSCQNSTLSEVDDVQEKLQRHFACSSLKGVLPYTG